MNDISEALSRLLSGDVTPEEAAELQALIRNEPDVAALWEAMQAVPEDLASLPDIPPPSALDAAILAPPETLPMRGWTAASVAPWLVAAAAVILVVFTSMTGPAEPELILAGTQWVEGDVRLLASDVPVHVDGRALISVEPLRPLPRVGGKEQERPMSRAAVLGALAGAAVTVAVYEGKARIGHADAATTLTAGQSTTVRGQAVWKGKGQPTLVRVKSPSDGDLDIELDPTNPGVAALMERIGVLEQELKAAHMAQAIQRGQLAQHTGDPVAWPKDVPEAWKPDVMEANLEAFIAEHPQMAIENIDCSEFPCVAVLSDPGDDLGDLPRQLAEQVFGKGTALSLARAKEADENGERGYLGVAAVPADMHAEDPNLSTRANYRSQLLMGELGDAAGHDEEHEE